MTDLSTAACEATVALLTGIPGVGDNVFLSRVYPMDVRDLPCLCIFSPTETVTQLSDIPRGARPQGRAVIINVTLVMGAPQGPRNTLEKDAGVIRVEIERRMAEAGKAGLRLEDSEQVATAISLNRIDRGLVDSGANTVVVSQLQYGCAIHHREGDHSRSFVRT